MTEIRNRFKSRKEIGSPEWLIDKWSKKIVKTFLLFGYTDGEFILPSIMRVDFERDINKVIEKRISELFPGKSLLGTIDTIRRKT
jgi:hypothetical protein